MTIGLPQQRVCGTMNVHYRLLTTDLTYARNRREIENRSLAYARRGINVARTGVTVIPVVVHVVYNSSNSEQNISEAQIRSQIDVLNRDFRKQNLDIASIPAAFQPLAADTQIEFVLATTDPNDNSTNGITRTTTTATGFVDDDRVKSAATGGADLWPSDRYLNLWVCQLNGGLLGYAQFPGGPAVTDGVVITHTGFGTTGTAAAPFNLGRTATHEIGHWLNLRHIWGDDGNGCNGSDFVDDTPNQAGPNFGTPSFPHVTCNNDPNGDMFMNYMDYTDDVGMFMFTIEQAVRMQAALDIERASIGTSLPTTLLTITNGDVGDFAGWAAASDVQVITGDFNGNGRTDIALVRQDGGWSTIPIAFSNGDGTFAITNGDVGDFATWAASSDVQVITGDFNGNGRTDIALVRQDGGWSTIPIAFSNGDGTFTITNGDVGDFATWAATSDARVITGDFNGDGRTDIALVRQDSGWGTIPIALSNGDGTFTITNGDVGDFAGWAATNNVRVITGDFNGDGRTDIALVRQDTGWSTIPIALSNGDGTFTITNSAVGDFEGWAVANDVRVITGDFNGNGRTDIALVRQDSGWSTIPIAFSNGDGTFAITNGDAGDFATWATANDVRVITGDFNGNGRTDIALVRQDSGWSTIPIAFSNGDGTFMITNSAVGDFEGWAVANDVRAITGDFNGDGRTDIALVRQDSGWSTIPIAFSHAS
jgi:hypothetical protein